MPTAVPLGLESVSPEFAFILIISGRGLLLLIS